MPSQMPRGAIPTPRSELAAAEPYRPQGGAEISAPSGEFPTPNHELAAAQPYGAAGAAPSPVNAALRGYNRLYMTDVLQADGGCDFSSFVPKLVDTAPC